jgi:hypothetical protein
MSEAELSAAELAAAKAIDTLKAAELAAAVTALIQAEPVESVAIIDDDDHSYYRQFKTNWAQLCDQRRADKEA